MDSRQIEHPFFGMVEITTRCNSRCVYCQCWQAAPEVAAVSPEVCKVLFPQMAALGVRKLILTGGEPLVRDDLEEIVQIAYAHRLHTSIVTNGLALTEKRLSTLIEAGTLGITLSVDSLDSQVYQQLRGVPFQRMKRALALLSQLAQGGDLTVSINCVLSALNYSQTPQLLQYATEANIPLMVQPCNTDAQSELTYLLPDAAQIPAVRTMIETLITMQQQGANLLNSAAFLRNITQYWLAGNRPPVSSCYYGYANVTVKHNGDVVPCWRLPAIGNLHSESLLDMWYNEKFAQWRQRMVSGRCPGCWLVCSFDWSTLWHAEEQVQQFWQRHQPLLMTTDVCNTDERVGGNP